MKRKLKVLSKESRKNRKQENAKEKENRNGQMIS